MGNAYFEMGDVIVEQQLCIAYTFCRSDKDKRNLKNNDDVYNHVRTEIHTLLLQ